jgi:hypothetical protein
MPDLLTALEPPWIRRHLRVPREDETLFAQPALTSGIEAAAQNHALLESTTIDVQGRSLAALRRWTRETVIPAAHSYTGRLLEDDLPTLDSMTGHESVFVSGHQPSLFHPGVWVKNFAISELATRSGGVALNLVIDNDTLSTSGLRLPSGSRDQPDSQTVSFDVDRAPQPWEDVCIEDAALFESFADRVVAGMASWEVTPLIAEIWSDAVRVGRETELLRDAFTGARVGLERRWGLQNLELPLSRLCTLDPFLWFASHIFAQLPKFHAVHNEVLTQYRDVNRIRSQSHPVPELHTDGEWLEAPFWMWRAGEQTRRHVFARKTEHHVELSDGLDVFAELPLTPNMDACCAVEVLRELPHQGIRLRTRALTTTLFSRLCLGDLFVHGIGGAKYDEMTDRIIYRMFGMQPPEFQTMSATLLLPMAEPFDVRPCDERRLLSQLRDLRYNSDRHIDDDGEAARPIAEKRALIEEQRSQQLEKATRRERRRRVRENHARFIRLKELADQLSVFSADQQERITAELQTVREQLTANETLKDREWSFCLYPEDKLRPFITQLWERNAV